MNEYEQFEQYLRGESEDLISSSKDNYDPFDLINRAVNSEFDNSVFEIIKDDDLPTAPNWLEFCIGSKYLNIKPFPKQIKFGLEFFSDYCPDCSDSKIMKELFDQPLQEILERIQVLHYGECPKCNKNRIDFHKEGKLGFYNELAGCAGQRGGKAQPLHSFIKVPNGWKKMGDIQVGDIVCTPDGGTAPVTGVFPQGKRKTYKVIFEDDRSTECCEDHLWTVFNEHWKRRCIRIKDGYAYPKTDSCWKTFSLKEIINRESKYPLFIPLSLYKGSNKDLPLDPYVLGLLLGDGCFTRSGISFTNIDEENLENLKTKLIEGYYLQKESVGSNSYRLTRGKRGESNYYIEVIKEVGLLKKKSYEKYIPETYKESSVEQRLELLRGLMDTDGNTSKKRLRKIGTPNISTSSKQLAEDIQYLVRSLGGLCRITSKIPKYTHKGIKKEGKRNYRCWIRHDNPEFFCKLSRKKENAIRNKEVSLKCRIKNIEYIGMQEVQCITVDHPDHLYITDEFVATHNSVFVAMCANYQLHRFLKLPNPSGYFNLLPNQTLHMTFIAITYKQAEDTLWQPFRDFYDNSPWFNAYNELLEYYEKKHSIKLYEKKSTFLWYDHKRLTCYAAGPDKRKLRGRTRFFSSIDELGWFHGTDKAIKLNPDQVCQALERSLRTVRSACKKKRENLHHYNAPDALFVNISSPSATNDKIMRLIREKNIPSRYIFHLPTWEMNPTISREDLESEYQDNPIDAERDYGANPPLSDVPFISNANIIQDLINLKYKNLCKYKLHLVTDKVGHTTIQVKQLRFQPFDPEINYIMGVDTGFSKNAFAVVIQHYNTEIKSSVIDLIIEVRPTENIPVHFPAMYRSVIEPIVKTGNIALVIFDKWQSINYEQELHDKGIESIRYSLKHDDFVNIKGLIFSKKIIIPRAEISFKEILNPSMDYHNFVEKRPVAHFIYQILAVRDLGRTVTKGLGVDDDIFRAWCLGVRFIFDKKYEKIFHKDRILKKRRKILGIVHGKSDVFHINTSQNTLKKSEHSLGIFIPRTK